MIFPKPSGGVTDFLICVASAETFGEWLLEDPVAIRPEQISLDLVKVRSSHTYHKICFKCPTEK